MGENQVQGIACDCGKKDVRWSEGVVQREVVARGNDLLR